MRLLAAAVAQLMSAGVVIAEPVTIFAAASLKTALDQVASDWSSDTVISYGGSAAMAQQILAGAPADIFISAANDWMDVLQQGGAIIPASRRDLWGNQLVLIAAKGSAELDLTKPDDFFGMLADGRLAMGQTETVPAGQYGRAALIHFGLWPRVQAQLAQTENVRAALELVALGEAPLGIVYATDVRGDPRVTIAARFPDVSHPAIVYSAALTKTAVPQAAAFLQYLTTPAASARFAAQGFSILGATK